MPSLERIRNLCEGIGRDLHDDAIDQYRIADAATALLLAVGSLERRLAEKPLPVAANERALADLRVARSTVQRIDGTIDTVVMEGLRADMVEARRLILDATSVLLDADAS